MITPRNFTSIDGVITRTGLVTLYLEKMLQNTDIHRRLGRFLHVRHLEPPLGSHQEDEAIQNITNEIDCLVCRDLGLACTQSTL